MQSVLYTYKAKVTAVYDGDTITVDWDLGRSIWMRGEKIRLWGIDAPEVRGEEREQGILARDALRELILGKEITLRTIKDSKGKYGRYLGIVFVGGIQVNDWMVENGFAEVYHP